MIAFVLWLVDLLNDIIVWRRGNPPLSTLVRRVNLSRELLRAPKNWIMPDVNGNVSYRTKLSMFVHLTEPFWKLARDLLIAYGVWSVGKLLW